MNNRDGAERWDKFLIVLQWSLSGPMMTAIDNNDAG